MTAAAVLLPGSASAQGNTSDGRSMNNVKDNYKLPFKFGLGGVPIGNEFGVVTDKDAYAILEAAWSAGIRLGQFEIVCSSETNLLSRVSKVSREYSDDPVE